MFIGCHSHTLIRFTSRYSSSDLGGDCSDTAVDRQSVGQEVCCYEIKGSMFKAAHYFFLTWDSWIHSHLHTLVPWDQFLILSSHLCLDHTSSLFCSGFQTKLTSFHNSVYATGSSHLLQFSGSIAAPLLADPKFRTVFGGYLHWGFLWFSSALADKTGYNH